MSTVLPVVLQQCGSNPNTSPNPKLNLNLLAHYFWKENSRVSVEGEMSMLRDIQAGVL
jgi:hypothetical protein